MLLEFITIFVLLLIGYFAVEYSQLAATNFLNREKISTLAWAIIQACFHAVTAAVLFFFITPGIAFVLLLIVGGGQFGIDYGYYAITKRIADKEDSIGYHYLYGARMLLAILLLVLVAYLATLKDLPALF